MWPLIRTEFTRLRLRRAVLVLLAAMILVPAVLFVAEAWNTRPFTDAEYAEAQANYEESLVYAQEELPNCLAEPQDWGVSEDLPEAELTAACEENMGYGGAVEDYLYRTPMQIERTNQDTGVAVITVLALLGALIGTTFVGHDWASGSMSNQLLFESRRPRIWLAKAVAVVVGSLTMAVVAVMLFWAAIFVLAQLRDVEATSDVWRDVVWTQARGLGLVAAAALAAYALTMWFRSTVGSLGLMFGVTLFSSLLIAAVFGVGAEKWMLPTNAMAVVMDGYEYWVPGTGTCDEYGNCDDTALITAAHGATYLGVILVLILVPSIVSFRRRDVP
ncbi:ABC transporter permease subunit [Nocardioides gilvus]|uniref:ABC transporter permease subunit n=1 Tax=Nocardioides gilvus TaxID=1735589 RepID=UPI000D74B25B|nr:ABC transporter permease subunit [Nocardioides gilvus]